MLWSATDDKSVELCLKCGVSLRLFLLEPFDRPLRPERTEAASSVFSLLDSPFASKVEFLGLSTFKDLLLLLPGILDRSERSDREESLVSDLLMEGYVCRASEPEPLPEEEPPPSLEAWLPMARGKKNDVIYRPEAIGDGGPVAKQGFENIVPTVNWQMILRLMLRLLLYFAVMDVSESRGNGGVGASAYLQTAS